MKEDAWNVGASYQPNLVLSVDYKVTERATGEEPTGEVMPLTQEELLETKMGDKFVRTRPPTKQAKEKKQAKRVQTKKLKLDEGFDMVGIYKPKSEQSRRAFEVLLSFVQEAIGDQPREVLYGAADEVLRSLKKERIKESEKRREVEALLEKVGDERFTDMVSMAKQIHDFNPDEEEREGDDDGDERDVLDEAVGVSVRLDDDEDEAEEQEGADITYELPDDGEQVYIGDDDEMQGTEAIHADTLKFAGAGAAMEMDDEGAVTATTGEDVTLIEKAKKDQAEYQRRLAEMGEGAIAAAGWSSSRRVVDIDAVAFSHGSHLMTNKKCVLPDGSQRTNKRSYESILVPAMKPRPFDSEEKLIAIDELPKWARDGFKGFRSLNRIQSKISNAAFTSDRNLLICAPTGAGKTNVALMCILRELSKHLDETGAVKRDAFKCIYIAPMRSLVQEMVGNFTQRLEPYGLVVGEMTGDVQMTKEQFKATQVVVCTPEKYDIITRKGGERAATDTVKLIIFDEIHLLHDDRGPVLEALVARINRHIEKSGEPCRLVGLSATLPNYEDVAAFLRVKPKYLFFFDNSYRPVPLEQEYIGITEKKGLKRYQAMNEVVYDKVMEHAGKNQVLIFVHSRKETSKTAKAIINTCLEKQTLSKFLREGGSSREVLRSEAEQARNYELRDILPYGFAIHHAGMSRLDRTLVEDLFSDRHIQVLVSTATLAWGVNLPAHAVIIKGTQIYNPEKSCWSELGALDVMQMMGRAGRPQYDSIGKGILLTNSSELQYYLSLMNQQLPIESQMVAHLPDALNAEVALGNVKNNKDALDWLSRTYLYVRMKRDPALYGVSDEVAKADPRMKGPRSDLVHTAALLLDKAGLVSYDKDSGNIEGQELGRIASHYYCTYESIDAYNSHLEEGMTEIDLFKIFAMSSEFKHIHIREEEKLELQKLAEYVPVPIKESVDEPSAKVNVLLQVYISQLKLDGFALQSDMVFISQSAARLFRAILDIVLWRKWAALALKVLSLCKMVSVRQWQSLSALHQFHKIPKEVVRTLDKKSFTLKQLRDFDASQLGELVRSPKMGKTLYKAIRKIPRFELRCKVTSASKSSVSLELILNPRFHWDDEVHGRSEGFWIFVEDTNEEVLLHHEYFTLGSRYAKDEHGVRMEVPLMPEPLQPFYFVRVVSDRWLGSESLIPVPLRGLKADPAPSAKQVEAPTATMMEVTESTGEDPQQT